jgi:hypothetical protein
VIPSVWLAVAELVLVRRWPSQLPREVGVGVTDLRPLRLRRMTADAAPGELQRRVVSRRQKLLVLLVLAAAVFSGAVVTGIADAAEHALAHAVPGLMPADDGCGGG